MVLIRWRGYGFMVLLILTLCCLGVEYTMGKGEFSTAITFLIAAVLTYGFHYLLAGNGRTLEQDRFCGLSIRAWAIFNTILCVAGLAYSAMGARGRIKDLEAQTNTLRSQLETTKERQDRIEEHLQAVRKSLVILGNDYQQRKKAGGTPQPASLTVHRGDNRDKVRKVFGRPASVSTGYPNDETWYYDFAYVVFHNGVVKEWSGLPIEP